jgi:hypothetical protein
MYYKLICILYALLCGQNFILVKSGCYISKALVYSKMKFYSEKNFAHFRPNRPNSQPAHPDFRPSRNPFFFLSSRSFPPPPLPTGPWPLGRPSSPHGPTGHLLPPPTSEPNARGAAAGWACAAPTVDPATLNRKEKKWPHQSPFIPPLIGATPLLQTPVTGAFKPGPLKLLQRRPLKALGLPRLASAL